MKTVYILRRLLCDILSSNRRLYDNLSLDTQILYLYDPETYKNIYLERANVNQHIKIHLFSLLYYKS